MAASVAQPCSASAGRRPQGPPAPAAEYGTEAWKEFTSEQGRFSVRMVGAPRPDEQEVETPLGKIRAHLYIAQTNTAGYMVGYADFPGARETPEYVKAVLDGARDRVLAGGGRLLSESEIKVEGYAGREWLIVDGPLLFRARAFLAKDRFYQVVLAAPLSVAFTTGRPSAEASARTDLYEQMSERFFGSFKLRGGQPGASR